MGYTNVALAVLDVGAETKVAQRLGPVAMDLAKSGVQVSRQKWSQVMGWVKQGPAGIEKTRAWLASVKGVTQEMADRAMDAISPVEVAGVGRVSRSEMRGTAEGTTEEAVQKARAGEQRKLKYSQVKNWNEIEPLLGQAVNRETKLPAGYTLYEKPGSKQLFILRDTADDGSVVPLMIENGKIQAGKTRLSRGRKVMEDALKAIGIDTPKGYQLNHLVPDAVAQSDPMIVEMLKRNIYDVDHAGNLLPMPSEVRGEHPDLIGHLGSHGRYNELVTEQLRVQERLLAKKYGSLDKVPDNEFKQAVQRVETRMRKGIMNSSPDIPTRYDPATKTRVLSEGLTDLDFVA